MPTGTHPPRQVSTLGLTDTFKSEGPLQRGWELEDKKLEKNAIIWKADERKRNQVEAEG